MRARAGFFPPGSLDAEASWPATLKRRKARKPVNGLRLSREEEQ